MCLSLDWFQFVDGAHLLQLWRLMLDRCVVKVASCSASNHSWSKKLSLFLNEEKLLRPQNTAWACNTNPADELLCRYLIVFHRVKPDQGSSTSKTCLTMNGDSSWIGLWEMSITNVEEIFNNIFRRVWTIYEKELVVSYSLSQKLATVVFCLIQSDNSLDIPLFEDITVLIRSKARSLSWLSAIYRAHKRREFPRNDPIDISVLNALVVLVLLDIEGLKIVPLLLDTVLETLQAMKNCALVVAFSLGGIAEWDELSMIGPECVICFLWWNFQHNNHERAHEESSISQFIGSVRAVMEYAIVFILVILLRLAISCLPKEDAQAHGCIYEPWRDWEAQNLNWRACMSGPANIENAKRLTLSMQKKNDDA